MDTTIFWKRFVVFFFTLQNLGHSSSGAVGCTCGDHPQLAAVSWESTYRTRLIWVGHLESWCHSLAFWWCSLENMVFMVIDKDLMNDFWIAPLLLWVAFIHFWFKGFYSLTFFLIQPVGGGEDISFQSNLSDTREAFCLTLFHNLDHEFPNFWLLNCG